MPIANTPERYGAMTKTLHWSPGRHRMPPTKPSRKSLVAHFVCSAWLLLLLVATVPAAVGARPAAPPRDVTARGPLDADELNNIAVFKAASPSVVNITALGLERDLFSLNVEQVPRGTGTGFVWDDARPHRHQLPRHPGRQRRARDAGRPDAATGAELVGVFADRDLAVLRIDAPEEQAARRSPIGTSRDLQVGQKVYAIGNPFGLDQTLTTGIVSALDREIESLTQPHRSAA